MAVNDTGGTITAAYSTGGHTGTGTNSTSSGGPAGTQNGTVNYSYWDSETSAIADANAPEGKTSGALQTPTAYGTGNVVYTDWNVNVDGVAGADTGLTGASYSFQVRARNVGGGGAASNVAVVTLTPAAPTLGAPTATYVAQSGNFYVTWTWTPPSPADASINSWDYRGASGKLNTTEAQWSELLYKAPWSGVPASTGATRTLTVTGLDGPAFRYQVRARNVGGGGTWSAARQIELVPETPDNLQGCCPPPRTATPT